MDIYWWFLRLSKYYRGLMAFFWVVVRGHLKQQSTIQQAHTSTPNLERDSIRPDADRTFTLFVELQSCFLSILTHFIVVLLSFGPTLELWAVLRCMWWSVGCSRRYIRPVQFGNWESCIDNHYNWCAKALCCNKPLCIFNFWETNRWGLSAKKIKPGMTQLMARGLILTSLSVFWSIHNGTGCSHLW